jgi:hypothetical protein
VSVGGQCASVKGRKRARAIGPFAASFYLFSHSSPLPCQFLIRSKAECVLTWHLVAFHRQRAIRKIVRGVTDLLTMPEYLPIPGSSRRQKEGGNG